MRGIGSSWRFDVYFFVLQKNSTPGRRMGDRGALDRFTIELYKAAKEMSIENSKKNEYFSCF